MVLTIRDLHGQFETAAGRQVVLAGVELELRAGGITALVGASGVGKSVLARAILRLPEPRFRVTRGAVLFDGVDLLTAPEPMLRRVRGSRVALVFQDARGALNPIATVKAQLDAVSRARGFAGKAAEERQAEVMRQVGLDPDERLLASYPHQLSGGTCQRVQLSLVLVGSPEVIVLDEPTSQLDVTVQASVASTIRGIVVRRAVAILLIAHDLGLVAGLADRVAIMAGGRIVEEGDVRTIFRAPEHPETRRLLDEARLRSHWLAPAGGLGG